MNKIIAQNNLKNISKRIYDCEIYSNNRELKLSFPDFVISSNTLIYKFGFPNNEVSHYTDISMAINAEEFLLYTLKETDWLENILKLNSNHPRHTNKLFESYSHFLLFLEDDTFECIATDFNIIQK